MFLKYHRLAGTQGLDHAPQIPSAVWGWPAEQGAAKQDLVVRLPTFGPADDGGVPHMVDMVPVGQEMVERCGVCKGGKSAGGGVPILHLPVRAEGRGIEGDQGRAAGLGAGYIFDRWVNAFDGPPFSGDQTDSLGPLARGVVVGFPGLANGRVLVDKPAIIPKQQVAAGEDAFQLVL